MHEESLRFSGCSPELVHLLLRLEDPNNTGVVDFSDSEALRATLKTGSMVSKLGIMFRAYDADSNGYLDREELVSAITEDRISAVVEAVFETAGEQHHLSCAECVSLLRTDPQICSMFDLHKRQEQHDQLHTMQTKFIGAAHIINFQSVTTAPYEDYCAIFCKGGAGGG